MKGIPILLLSAWVNAHEYHYVTSPLYQTSDYDFKKDKHSQAFPRVPAAPAPPAAEEEFVFKAAPFAPEILRNLPEYDDRVYNKAMMYVQLGIHFFNIPFILMEVFIASRCPQHISVANCDTNLKNFINNTTPFLRIYARIVNIIALFEKIWMKDHLPCFQLHAFVHKETPLPIGVDKSDCHISLSSTYAGLLVNIGGYIDLFLGSVAFSKINDWAEWEGAIPYNYLHGTMVWVTLDLMRLMGGIESGDYWWYARETGREFGRIWDLIFAGKFAINDINEKRGADANEWNRLKAAIYNYGVWKHAGHVMTNLYYTVRLYIDQNNLTTRDRTLASRKGAWWYPLDIFIQLLSRIGMGAYGIGMLVKGQPGYYKAMTEFLPE